MGLPHWPGFQAWAGKLCFCSVLAFWEAIIQSSARMAKKLVLACDTKLKLPFSKLNGIQGALKAMAEEDFEVIKNSFLKDGIDFSWTVWKDKKGKWWVIDGHGRLELVKKLAEEGYEIPSLPCVETYAKSFEEAKLKVLRSSSVYHKTTKQGLYEFMSGAGLKFDDILQFRIPEISIPEFKMEYFSEAGSGEREEDTDTQAEAFEKYKNQTIKQIVLYFPTAEYEKMLQKLDGLLAVYQLEDYSEVVWKLVHEATRVKKKAG